MKKSIISMVLVLAIVFVTVACGSAPAKNDDAVVEKSEPAAQEQTTADKSFELSEKDKQVSEKDLEDLSNLSKLIEMPFDGILSNDFSESLSDPRIDEVLKKARISMEEFSIKVAELPSVVDFNGRKVRKEYYVYLSELFFINLELLDKYVKFLREIEQVLNDMNYINNDKNKNLIGELARILNHWIWKQMEEKDDNLIKKIEEKYGVKKGEWDKFFFFEEQPAEQKEINDKKAPEEKKEDPNILTDEEKNQILWREDEFQRMLEEKLNEYMKEQKKENDNNNVPEKTEE